MQRFILLIAFLSSLIACTNSKSGGEEDLETNACHVIGLGTKSLQFKDAFGKIINGTACEDAPAPVVVLAIEYADGSALCTGTMLTKTDVLTAGHCFIDEPISVLVGNTVATVSSVEADTVRVHPDFAIDPLTGAFFHDVALVHLSRPLEVPIMPIYASRLVQVGEVVSIFGYGQDEKKKVGTLKSGEMRVSAVTNDLITANFDGEGSNTCFGDSGGPMILMAKRNDGQTFTGIIGTTSGGSDENCRKGDVSSFANVQTRENLDFIRRNVRGVVVY